MDNMSNTLMSEMDFYVRKGINADTEAIYDWQKQSYAIIGVPHDAGAMSSVILHATIQQNRVIIHVDYTDRPLWKALTAAGVTRDNIVLAYAGEPAPTPTDS